MKGTRGKALALLGVAFGVGVLTGAAGMAMADGRKAPVAPGRGPDYYLQRLTGALDLSAGQRDSVKAVLDRHAPEMERVWDEVRPKMTAVRQRIRAEIRVQLSPVQLKQYEALLARDDAERARARAAAVARDTTGVARDGR
ncbi:MAG: periplasmic heavy metal sensor [Gemmatimonadales bacterium]|nr:periplasmic heavy metal sensor [Gemmatimonadales bacterium]